jgi:esterase/lipase superfamily enzyme
VVSLKCSSSETGIGLPLIIFPTSFGRSYQKKDFGLVGSIGGFIDPGDRIRTHNAYENMIVHDVFDFARRECGCHRVAVCGAPLGAYHAPNLLISLSGSFDISSFFDGYHDDNVCLLQQAV